MIKTYRDTDIFINEERNNILITRGFWNFNQILFDLQEEKNKEYIVKVFEELNNEGFIDETKLNKDLLNNFNQLVKIGLLYKIEDNKMVNSNKILFISDDIDYLNDKLMEYKFTQNAMVQKTSDFAEKFFLNITFGELKQDPLKAQNIKDVLEKFLADNEIKIIVVMLNKVNHEFCSIINSIILDKQILYCLFDKDFTYMFGTKINYTGCYACFSNRMFAKMKMSRRNYEIKPIRSKEYIGVKHYLKDFVFSLLQYNLEEFISTSVLPISGRIAAIFNNSMEIRYENLLRLSFCPECGYIGRLENKERNVKLKNFLREVNSCD